jgi:hypothetical protein
VLSSAAALLDGLFEHPAARFSFYNFDHLWLVHIRISPDAAPLPAHRMKISPNFMIDSRLTVGTPSGIN